MIPAGYLLKRIRNRPDWLKATQVTEICSVSDCVNDNAVDVQAAWEHNEFGVANAPETLWQLAEKEGADISDADLFYYEVYEQEADNDSTIGLIWEWRPLTNLPSSQVLGGAGRPSNIGQFLGYDIVVCGDYLGHSPLSCNHMGETLPVNQYCLLTDLEQARDAVKSGAFEGCKPGVYKIYSVYRIGRP